MQEEIIREKELKIQIPKYFYHGNHKCVTPKEIIAFQLQGYSSIVFGDKRLDGKIAYPKQMLEDARKRGYLILVLKKTKKRGGHISFPIPYINVISSRKKRLANIKNIEKNKINQDKTLEKGFLVYPTLSNELGVSLEAENIEDLFLTSAKDSIIIQDIKRLIHLKFEEQWNNGK